MENSTEAWNPKKLKPVSGVKLLPEIVSHKNIHTSRINIHLYIYVFLDIL